MSSSKSSSAPPAKRQKNSGRRSYFLRSSVAPILSTTRCINVVPVEVWKEHICHKFLNLTELSIMRRVHTFFEKYWQNMMTQNVIRVPQGCPTLEKAMALAVIFSGRKEYTTDDPLKIRLEEGVHEIVGDQYRDSIYRDTDGCMNVTCSHITFVGKGKNHTTIHGGFIVTNQQNIQFEGLTISTFSNSSSLRLGGRETKVEMLKCCIKESKCGMSVFSGATVTATQCEFMENFGSGVFCRNANTKTRLNNCTMHNNAFALVACDRAVVDLHGTKTDIHSNKAYGIHAYRHGKANIHLPFQHNTTHDNVEEDRHQEDGGSIANINADGTFTHVAHM
jgi:hypothetical protein